MVDRTGLPDLAVGFLRPLSLNIAFCCLQGCPSDTPDVIGSLQKVWLPVKLRDDPGLSADRTKAGLAPRDSAWRGSTRSPLGTRHRITLLTEFGGCGPGIEVRLIPNDRDGYHHPYAALSCQKSVRKLHRFGWNWLTGIPKTVTKYFLSFAISCWQNRESIAIVTIEGSIKCTSTQKIRGELDLLVVSRFDTTIPLFLPGNVR